MPHENIKIENEIKMFDSNKSNYYNCDGREIREQLRKTPIRMRTTVYWRN